VSRPLFFEEDEQGDLFLTMAATYNAAGIDAESCPARALDDAAKWEAYVQACMVASNARRAVLDASRPVTETDLHPRRKPKETT
jgi:hypothetical protein